MDSSKITAPTGTCGIDLTDLTQDSTTDWNISTNITTPITITGSGPYYNTTSGSLVWRSDPDDFEIDTNGSSGKISLRGDNADIDVNGVSLMDTLKDIQDRLSMLCPDPEMEAEWDELRAIRDQYEAKLKECQEKSRAWKALQQKG